MPYNEIWKQPNSWDLVNPCSQQSKHSKFLNHQYFGCHSSKLKENSTNLVKKVSTKQKAYLLANIKNQNLRTSEWKKKTAFVAAIWIKDIKLPKLVYYKAFNWHMLKLKECSESWNNHVFTAQTVTTIMLDSLNGVPKSIVRE